MAGPLDDGVTVFYMRCGSLPFDGFSQWDLISNIAEGRFDVPPELAAVGPACDLVTAHMMAVDPAQRSTLQVCQKHPWFASHGDAAVLESMFLVDGAPRQFLRREQFVSSLVEASGPPLGEDAAYECWLAFGGSPRPATKDAAPVAAG